MRRFVDDFKVIKDIFLPVRKQFIAQAREMFRALKKKVTKKRKYPVTEYGVWDTDATMLTPRSIRQMMMDVCNGGYEPVDEWIVRNMRSRKITNHVSAQEGLGKMYVEMAGRGHHSAVGKRLLTCVRGAKRWSVIPYTDRPFSVAFKDTFKVDITEVVIFKGEEEEISENEFLSIVERYKERCKPTKAGLRRFIKRMRAGGHMMSEPSLKREMHTKYPKMASYATQPLTEAYVTGIDIVVVPACMGFDGTAKTLYPLGRKLHISSKCIKMMGIGRPGKSEDHLIMDLYHHDDANTYVNKHTVKMSYNIFKRLPLANRDKAVKCVLDAAIAYLQAFGSGGRLLAKLILKMTSDDDSEIDKKQTHMAVHLGSILYIVGSSLFGSMRHLLLTMMTPMIKKILFRMEVPGTIAPLVEDSRLERGEIRVPKNSIHKVSDTVIGWGQPMFLALQFRVAIKEGDALGMHVEDMLIMDRDGDGDIGYAIPVELFGPLFNVPWHEYESDISWVVHKGAPVANLPNGLADAHKKVIRKIVGEAGNVGELMGYFNQFWQELERGGAMDTKEARFFMRDVHLGLVQPAIAGKKHDTKHMDVDGTLKALIAIAKSKWPWFKFHDRSVAEYVCSGSLNYRSDVGMVLLNEHHPLAAHLVSKKWAKWVTITDPKTDEVKAEGWKVDVNKVIAEVHGDVITNPFQRVVFDTLKDIKLGAPPNRVFEQARVIVSTHGFMWRFAEAIGIRPDTGRQVRGGLVSLMMDIWLGDRREGKDMTTSQQTVDELVRTELPKVAAELGISEHLAKVFAAIVFMSYTSTTLNGLYGGLFAFETEVLWTAGKLVDGSWLMWLAEDEKKKEEKLEKECGVSIAVIDGLMDTIKKLGLSE
jgi:hypothetical protein